MIGRFEPTVQAAHARLAGAGAIVWGALRMSPHRRDPAELERRRADMLDMDVLEHPSRLLRQALGEPVADEGRHRLVSPHVVAEHPLDLVLSRTKPQLQRCDHTLVVCLHGRLPPAASVVVSHRKS